MATKVYGTTVILDNRIYNLRESGISKFKIYEETPEGTSELIKEIKIKKKDKSKVERIFNRLKENYLFTPKLYWDSGLKEWKVKIEKAFDIPFISWVLYEERRPDLLLQEFYLV